MDDEVREYALQYLHGELARDDAKLDEAAICWIVELTNPDDESRDHYGPFMSPPEAMAWAESFETDLNRGIGDDTPWTTKIYRLNPVLIPKNPE